MSKYKISEERLSPNENFLQCIANELAEKNRLKIIELKFMDELNETGHLVISEDDLVDKA